MINKETLKNVFEGPGRGGGMKEGERSVGGHRFILHVLSSAKSSDSTPQLSALAHDQ